VKELVYHARNSRTDGPLDTVRERLQARHVHAGERDAGRGPECKRRQQTVAQRNAETGQRAERARCEVDHPGGLAIGQAHQRHDGQHIARGHDSGEPAGLRVGQRPGLDELREERRYG